MYQIQNNKPLPHQQTGTKELNQSNVPCPFFNTNLSSAAMGSYTYNDIYGNKKYPEKEHTKVIHGSKNKIK